MFWFISLFITSTLAADDCTKDAEVLKGLLQNGAGSEKPDTDQVLQVDVGLNIRSMHVVPHTNSIHLDAVLTRKWQDQSIYFSHLNPCHHHISLSHKKDTIWVPDIAFSNSQSLVLHRHSLYIDAHQNGTITHSQRVEFNVPCTTDAFDYPWGNTSCTALLRSESASRDFMELVWDSQTSRHALDGEQTVGDLELQLAEFSLRDHFKETGVHDELNLTFSFKRTTKKTLFLFYIPSILFILMSWLSLLLGPMAITRSVLVVGSLILLQMHYYVNMAGLPETSGITAIDVWKMFSFFFVFATFVELVSVTCMASAGRTRKFSSCAGKSHKGRYELEPLYEELNDLRQRKTHRTCRCCRYSALFLDTITFFGFAAIFLLFVFLYYTRGTEIVRWISDVNIDHIKIPSVF